MERVDRRCARAGLRIRVANCRVLRTAQHRPSPAIAAVSGVQSFQLPTISTPGCLPMPDPSNETILSTSLHCLAPDPSPDSDNLLASRSSPGSAKVFWLEAPFCRCLSQNGQAVLSQDRPMQASEGRLELLDFIVNQKTRHLRIQKTDIRLTRRSAVLSFKSSARQPDFSILWNASIFHLMAYQSSFSMTSWVDSTGKSVISFQSIFSLPSRSPRSWA
jgi:hypothetical protein